MKKRLLLTLLATAMLTLVACSSDKSAEAAPEPEVTVTDFSDIDPEVAILGNFYGRDFADGITLQYLMDNVQDYSEIHYDEDNPDLIKGFYMPRESETGPLYYIVPRVEDGVEKSVENAENVVIVGYIVNGYTKTTDNISWGGCKNNADVLALFGEPHAIYSNESIDLKYEYIKPPYEISFDFTKDGVLKTVICSYKPDAAYLDD